MSREIKFRAFYPELGMSAPFRLGLKDIAVTFDDCGSYYALSGLPHGTEVMQYTGLKDKNGVEIYEGDIVSAHIEGAIDGPQAWIEGEVKWHDRAAKYVVGTKHTMAMLACYKVIGNIHEEQG